MLASLNFIYCDATALLQRWIKKKNMWIHNARPASSGSSLPRKNPKTTAWWEFLKIFGITEGNQVSSSIF